MKRPLISKTDSFTKPPHFRPPSRVLTPIGLNYASIITPGKLRKTDSVRSTTSQPKTAPPSDDPPPQPDPTANKERRRATFAEDVKEQAEEGKRHEAKMRELDQDEREVEREKSGCTDPARLRALQDRLLEVRKLRDEERTRHIKWLEDFALRQKSQERRRHSTPVKVPEFVDIMKKIALSTCSPMSRPSLEMSMSKNDLPFLAASRSSESMKGILRLSPRRESDTSSTSSGVRPSPPAPALSSSSSEVSQAPHPDMHRPPSLVRFSDGSRPREVKARNSSSTNSTRAATRPRALGALTEETKDALMHHGTSPNAQPLLPSPDVESMGTSEASDAPDDAHTAQ